MIVNNRKRVPIQMGTEVIDKVTRLITKECYKAKDTWKQTHVSVAAVKTNQVS